MIHLYIFIYFRFVNELVLCTIRPFVVPLEAKSLLIWNLYSRWQPKTKRIQWIYPRTLGHFLQSIGDKALLFFLI